MDPGMQIFYIVWMFVLPIVAVTLITLIPVFWFFVVPKLARKMTWWRFRNVSIHAVGDDAGYVELVATKEYLPEGIELTKRGWHFLPRPIYEKGNPIAVDLDQEKIEKLGLRKYTLKDLGKPFWYDYAGKITSTNPGVLAALQQTKQLFKIDRYVADIQKFVNDLPEHFKKPLNEKLKSLKKATRAQPITHIDIEKIKQIVPKMYPPSLIDALAANRELKGMKKAGKQYGGLILGGALIIGLVIIAILALAFLMG